MEDGRPVKLESLWRDILQRFSAFEKSVVWISSSLMAALLAFLSPLRRCNNYPRGCWLGGLPERMRLVGEPRLRNHKITSSCLRTQLAIDRLNCKLRASNYDRAECCHALEMSELCV